MPVYDPPIPVGLLKCMQPKSIAHERREGVLPFKPKGIGDHVQACTGTPVGILQLECYMVLYVSQLAIFTEVNLNQFIAFCFTHTDQK